MAKAQVMWHKMNQIIAKCVKCVCVPSVCVCVWKVIFCAKVFHVFELCVGPCSFIDTKAQFICVFICVSVFCALFLRFFLALAIVESSHKAAEGLSLAGRLANRWQVAQREVSSDTIRFVNENEPQHELAICQIDFLSLRFALVRFDL